MRELAFHIVDTAQPTPVVVVVDIETDKRAWVLARTLLDRIDDLRRIEVHEHGRPLFVVGRIAAL